MFKTIAFDLDGTLINAYPAVEESINYLMKEFGLPSIDGDVIKRAVGLGDRHLVQTFVGPERIERAMPRYREYHAQALLRGSSFLPGALEALEILKAQGYQMAIVSNRPKQFSMIVMEHLGMVHFFKRILCGDEVARAKPYPDILLQLMSELEVSKEELLYVGDMDVDVQTAKRAQVAMVAVLTGSCSEEELRANGAEIILNDVGELSSFLAKNSLQTLKSREEAF